MNNLYRIFVLLFVTAVFSNSCSEEQKNNNQNTNDTTVIISTDINKTIDTSAKKIKSDTIKKSEIKKKPIKTFKYICPLGCKKGKSDIKGTCPECGMELIENPDYITKKNE